MTPDRLRAIRAALGLSQADFARAIGLSGTDPARTVRNWESGDIAVTGPAALAAEYLGQGALDDTMKRLMPEFVEGTALADDDGTDSPEFVIRLWRPRFVATIAAANVKLPPGAEWAWIERGAERLVVAMWIDDPGAPPGFDARDIVRRAAALYQARSLASFGP